MMHRSEAASPFGAAHLLFYEFTRSMMQRPEIAAVTMGREWFPPRPSLTQFKKHAGYQIEETRIAVVLHPSFDFALGHPMTRKALHFLRKFTRNYSTRIDSLEILDAAAMTRLPSASSG